VKTSWLLDSERQFPVNVDPTVNVTTNNAAWWTGEAWNDGLEFSGHMFVGNDAGYWGAGFARFNLYTIPDGSSVNSVIGYVNRYGVTGTLNNNSRWIFTNSGDPIITFGIYASMTAQLSPVTAGLLTNGWKNSTFNAAGVNYVQNSIANDFVSVGI